MMAYDPNWRDHVKSMTYEERQEALNQEYLQEPWARLAAEAGFRPVDTESAARQAFRFCAEKFNYQPPP